MCRIGIDYRETNFFSLKLNKFLVELFTSFQLILLKSVEIWGFKILDRTQYGLC